MMTEAVRGSPNGAGPLAYIAASFIPGLAANSFQIMKMSEAIATAPRDVVLVAARGNGPVDTDALRRSYGIARVPPFHFIPLRPRWGIHEFNLRAAWFARRIGASLVLSRSVGAAAIAARLGLPTIWECHGPPQGFERRYWSMLVGAKGFRRLVVISDALRRIMTEQYPQIADLDVIVAHDGVDIARFSNIPPPEAAKRAAGRDPARPIAGYAGHLYEGRGIDVILDCARALPHWTFLVAGGAPADVAALTRRCQELDLSNVELLGFVENAELPGRLAVADVLLMPYQRRVMVSGGRLDTAQWMSPLKMFEYMAMGRAIVASDLPVLREVLDDSCAVLVEPDRSADWIAALERAINDRTRWQSLSDAARQRVTAYGWPMRVRRMFEGIGAGPLEAEPCG